VGESGCGKSTTGRLIDHLIEPDSGEIWFDGKNISHLSEKEMRPLRADVQMIFQDPYASLNPRIKIQDQLGEPLLLHTKLSAGERRKKVPSCWSWSASAPARRALPARVLRRPAPAHRHRARDLGQARSS
jgi:ABC-type microcin C transport system duplicated ATPase subunit YejF